MIRVIIAEDHPIVREGITLLLNNEPDITIIAEAGNGITVVQLVSELSPDLVLMDMSMPDMNGIEATRRIIAEAPQSRVLVLTMHSDKRFVKKALSAGARGFILKGGTSEELLQGIRAVAAGELFFSAKIMDHIFTDYMKLISDGLSIDKSDLTPREREVLQLIAEGKSTKEIAFILEVTVKTVETHRQQLMKKLNMFSIAELTKYAVREGVTSLE